MRPETEAEVADVIRGADAPLRIVGGGTRMRRHNGGRPLFTSGLTGITLYEPAALTLVVRTGTPLAEVEAALAAEGQMLAFEPPTESGIGAYYDELLEEEVPAAEDRGTIGGVIAANASGPRRVQAGAARDALIGVRFVDGTGAVIANGGRVMKNVTGYDLVKLLAGSRGSLGVITEVALKTAPIPPSRVTLRIGGIDAADAVPVLTDALTGPWDVSGAGWLPAEGAVFRLEGLPGSVALRAQALSLVLASHGPIETVEPTAADAIWRRIGALGAGWGAEAAGLMEGSVWRVVCRPSQAAGILAANRCNWPLAMDWGGALLVLGLGSSDMPVLPAGARAAGLYAKSGVRLPAPDPVIARLESGLRARFDPRGLFAVA